MLNCGSNKKSSSNKIPKYVCLDSTIVHSQLKKYYLEIPTTWCSYLDIHGLLSYSPNSISNLKDDSFSNQLIIIAFDNKTFKSKNIEESLKNHDIENISNSAYITKYTSDVHAIYGKYYIIKNRIVYKDISRINLKLLYNYNRQDYIINYSVLEKDYDSYMDEVLQIINSFQIRD